VIPEADVVLEMAYWYHDYESRALTDANEQPATVRSTQVFLFNAPQDAPWSTNKVCRVEYGKSPVGHLETEANCRMQLGYWPCCCQFHVDVEKGNK